MASIKKRDNGRYRARYRDVAGKEHARHFDRKVDAQRWLDEVTAAVVTGQYVDPASGRVTFTEWFREWSVRQVWARGTTIAAEQAAASVTFGDLPLRAIRPSHVQAWVKTMSARLAPSTVRTRYNYVHMAFRAAVVDRVIPTDPSESVRLPRVRRADAAMTIPTPEEVAAALEVAPAWFRPFIGVCAFAGLRLGEAAGLQVGDVDFLRRTITVARQVQGETRATTEVVPPKYGSERMIHVPEGLTAMLAERIREVGTRGEERWLLTAGPELLNRNSAGRQWRQVREAAGLGIYTLHDLRHFYASGLIAAGCDVVTVQRALGHASPSITLDTYSHLWPTAEDKTRKAAEGLVQTVMAATQVGARALADSPRTGGGAR